MIVQCPHCRTRYEINDQEIKKEKFRVECPACSTLFQGSRKPDRPEEKMKLESRSAPPPTAFKSEPTPAKTVLVVDDSQFFREMILDILGPLRANLLVATDGVEALEMINNRKPDVVLLDLNLPKKNGFEIIREVRSSPALKDTCLLAMSGIYHKEADAAEAKKVGANDFIKKSFTPEELQQFVKMWLIW